MNYIKINNILQKDILLEAPPVGGNVNSLQTGRYYVHGKALSRTSKTGQQGNHDLYLHRRFDNGPPKRATQSSFSIDRFEISSSGIKWTANSGSNIGDRWDGTYKRNPVAQDVYVWKLSYSYHKHKQKKQTRVGTVTVVR